MPHRLPVLRAIICTLVVLAATVSIVYGQGASTTAAISGVVRDQQGGVLPGADVSVKHNGTAAESLTVTDADGRFSVPALGRGVYTVTVSLSGFKSASLPDVALAAGMPATVRVVLEIGSLDETVVVTGGAELVQTQSAAVSSTLTSNQISALPLATRNAVDFISQLPGVDQTGVARNATIMGHRSGAINLTIDGVNVQESFNKVAFDAFINPRLDAIEEASVSMAGQGAEAGSQGAVQVKYSTRSGSNQFKGSVYDYIRRTNFNTNYYFNEQRGAPRDQMKLDIYGFRVGGPIVVPGLFNGRDRAFFFFNYEEMRQPGATSVSRSVMTPQAQQGIFQYTGGSVNLYDLARQYNQTSTPDPIIATMLTSIRAATTKEGALKQGTDPNVFEYAWSPRFKTLNRYPTTRIDVNLTSSHRLSVTNYIQRWDTNPSVVPTFPGFPIATNASTRYQYSAALRSALPKRFVNEFKVGGSGGVQNIYPEMTADAFGVQGGFHFNALQYSNQVMPVNSNIQRDVPMITVDNTLTWTRGAHTLQMGANFVKATLNSYRYYYVVPLVYLGVESYDPANILFSNGPGGTMPTASATDLANARSLYATLTGRVTTIASTGFIDGKTGKYVYTGRFDERASMSQFDGFLQEKWQLRPNLTINAGVRYALQLPLNPLNDSFSWWSSPDDLYGISGPGNIFKPGVMTGKKPSFVQYKKGDNAYKTDWNNFGPSIGVAWRPTVNDGWLKRLVSGEPVLRAGYNLSFYRENFYFFTDMFSYNPGGKYNGRRDAMNGLLVGPGESWPLLYRDTARLGPPPIPERPQYPIYPLRTDSLNNFDPAITTPQSHSFTLSFGRAIGKNSSIELRYAGTRDRDGWGWYNFNEVNVVENGFLEEFKKAQANLQANMLAGRGNTFKYAGPGTGTSPLPTYLAFFSAVPMANAGDAALYTSTQFSNSVQLTDLAIRNPNPNAAARRLWVDGQFLANATAAGVPANWWVVNPDVGRNNMTFNGPFNNYDAFMIDFTRRLSAGLQVMASYTYAVGKTSMRNTAREGYQEIDNVGVVPHNLKFNWVYQLPVGRNRRFGSNMNRVLDAIIGGWEFDGLGRVQVGRLYDFGNVNLVGMTDADLQKAFKIRREYDESAKMERVYMLPDDIIVNTMRAYSISATSLTGYSGTAPTGRYIAPANGPDCVQAVGSDTIWSDCAPRHHFVSGPAFAQIDFSLMKRVPITKRISGELRLDVINVFDNINFNATTGFGSQRSTFWVTSAYQDIAYSQNPGGRLGQISWRVSW